MKKTLAGLGAFALLATTACADGEDGADVDEDVNDAAEAADTDDDGATSDDAAAEDAETDEDCAVLEHAMGLRWQQQSAEAKALQAQTYRLAEQRLEELVDEADGEDLALITDLDETAVDNSELLARDMAQCHDYTDWETWDHWEREGTARVIPGALEFFERADELGVTIVYLSDRTEENLDDTLAMLEELEFPQVEEDQVLLLGPPKQERRESVEAEYELIMQLGDTLHDFHEGYAGADLEEQHDLIEEHADRWGDDWFVLPNPTYGSWQEAELDEWDAEMEFGTYDEEGNH
ncbi:HAD family acid phosphatase [Nesterenkonia sp. CL21]|uniref:5'-nucleotidase, lipoprotein e(P4) family n=1 Tax=Nesterenkonia sp. CL21 TaxID=3064894 RepID=UPI00287A6034|nr:HAD family acid phosphatase [Nesterenkonia sp. CL21]MDS2173445.1 HAD family acid phosphatase [Nesterenkonia sp. CL21]